MFKVTPGGISLPQNRHSPIATAESPSY
jgi:hypothetical protein